MDNRRSNFVININKLVIGGLDTKLTNSDWNGGNKYAMIDSGTTVFYTPSHIYS